MINPLSTHPYILKVKELSNQFPERNIFHEKVGPMLKEMALDIEFLALIVKRNFNDQGYLNQVWSGYNIPYFLVYEDDHVNIKIHLFPPHPQNTEGIAAHCIHHHNNYILTTYAFFGSGYETMLFKQVNETKNELPLKLENNFNQQQLNPHTVKAWQPHVVFIPQDLSATFVIWTPDKVRNTDAFKSISFIKAIKNPLRKIIQTLGLSSTFGIANAQTHQFYVENNTFKKIEEQTYFSVSKAEIGEKVNTYSANMIFAFLQQHNLFDTAFFTDKLKENLFPNYYKNCIQAILNKEKIPTVFHRTEINIPNKFFTKEQILKASEV